jgi:hypothetical protein
VFTLYRKLLVLYPAQHREQFGEEMADVFRQAEQSRVGFIARGRFYLKELAGILQGVLREHLRILVGGDAALSLYTRRFTMHNGFRFPKATAVLMTLILAGVVLAIHKGEVIATSLAPFSQPVTPIHPAHSYLLPGVVAGFLFFYAVGLAGWAILFALRRSGVHRLDEMSTERK